jgi:hypothetical protein
MLLYGGMIALNWQVIHWPSTIFLMWQEDAIA